MITMKKNEFEEHKKGIAKLVEKYGIVPQITDGKVTGFELGKRPESDAEVRKIVAEQYTIQAYFIDNLRAERETKAATIPGLEEIKKAIHETNEWNAKFMASFDSESGGGQGIGLKPNYDINTMKKEYPIAAAYIEAENYSCKSNYDLSKIGKKTLNAIIENPDNYKEIMAEMERDLDEFTKSHMWD